MSDSWINRFVVSGPVASVRTFETAAAVTEGPAQTSLSFARLLQLLPEDERGNFDEPVEPWHDTGDSFSDAVEPPEEESRQAPDWLELTYRFVLDRHDTDPLLIRTSALFPTLCFVLGWVAPNVDEQRSRFIHNGDTDTYELSDDQAESIRAENYLRYGTPPATAHESDDDNLLWAEIEADWAMLDVVVEHWEPQVARTLSGAHNES
jgi:hypothetical protein